MGRTIDLIQKYDCRKLDKPEIRVWCHPRRIGGRGDDYYKLFDVKTASVASIAKSLAAARSFISHHEESEAEPLVAYDGHEFTEEAFWQYYRAKNSSRKDNQ